MNFLNELCCRLLHVDITQEECLNSTDCLLDVSSELLECLQHLSVIAGVGGCP
jgi:hypothetical protein